MLRLYRNRHEAPQQTIAQLQALYSSWADSDIGLELPMILEAGERGGRQYSVDRRFSGRPFSPWLASAEPGERRTALLSFLDATARLAALPSPVPGFARLVGPNAPADFDSAAELARNMLVGPALAGRSQLARDQPDAVSYTHLTLPTTPYV